MRKLAVLLLLGMWLGCRAEVSEPAADASQDAGLDAGPVDTAQCVEADKPTCCVKCEDQLVQPVCGDGGSWSCPEGSTDERQCPSSPGQRACWLPGSPQETYTYPGCPNVDYGCPRLGTVYCALESIRAEYSTCEQDSDCVAVGVEDRCAGYGQCPPAMVNTAGRQAFAGRANSELLRYCGTSPTCVSSGGSCAYPSFTPRCKQGHCVAEPSDAGQ